MGSRVRVAAQVASFALLVGTAPRLSAQEIGVGPFVQLGSEADERARLGHLLGTNNSLGYLMRSPASLSRRPSSASPARLVRIGLIGPEVRAISNSDLPFSLNDGALWAGRGLSTIVTTGLRLDAGPVHLMLAPQLTTSENRAYQVIPYPQSDTPPRSVWANPFHPPASSIDAPLRFGDAPLQQLNLGQSSLSVGMFGVEAGVATQNLWWGPGIRNGLVMSSNAAGFPHAFLQTGRSLQTPGGAFDAQWIVGRLDESAFFDANSSNDVRSISGIAATWTPPWDTGLSIGGARTVITTTGNRNVPASAVIDVFRLVGQPNTDTTHAANLGRSDQLMSFFMRWVFPRAGFETYAEWARFEEPVSLRDFLEAPGHSQGYTLGLQWARSLASGRTVRLQSEATYLEPDPSQRVRPVATTYTSRAVPQGFTNRGKVLGAAIGQGSSSQWFAADVFGASTRLGAFAGRVRWDNATLWDPIVPQVKNEDVSLMGGARGSVRWKRMLVLVEYTHAVRLDYLFQDKITDPARGTHGGVDFTNRTVSLTLSTSERR